MTPRFAAWVSVGAWFVAANVATAQAPRELRVEAGAAQLQQIGRDARSAAILGASWRQTDSRLASIISGEAAWAKDSVAALQGVAAMVFRPTVESRFLTEGGLTGAAFGISNIGRGGNASAFARQRAVLGEGSGLWVGSAFGSSVRDALVSHATTVDAGFWATLGDFQGTVTLARHRTDDVPLFEASGIFLTRLADSYDINDASLSLHYAHGRLTLDALQSWRSGTRATAASQSAFAATAVWALSRRYAVAVSAGRQLADPVRGTPDARMMTAALRFSWASAPEENDDVSGASSFVRVVPGEGGSTVWVHVTAPDSSLVTLAGSFSGWEPVQLHRVSNGWEAELFLKPGRYRIAVRVDNGPWRAPGNLAKMKDEYDGQNGLLIIP